MNTLPFSSHNRLPEIDLFTDTAAILDSIVSDIYYGMLRGQIHTNLPPEHPIITIWNRIQNSRRIGKKVYYLKFSKI